MNGIDSVLARLREYLDHFLQPLVSQTRGFLKDTQAILHILQNVEVSEDLYIFTLDVISLYTNIPQQKGLEAVKWAFQSYNSVEEEQVEFILSCTEFAL